MSWQRMHRQIDNYANTGRLAELNSVISTSYPQDQFCSQQGQ